MAHGKGGNCDIPGRQGSNCTPDIALWARVSSLVGLLLWYRSIDILIGIHRVTCLTWGRLDWYWRAFLVFFWNLWRRWELEPCSGRHLSTLTSSFYSDAKGFRAESVGFGGGTDFGELCIMFQSSFSMFSFPSPFLVMCSMTPLG